MEETQIENPKPVSLSLRPRRHLQSETYRTLVRILSYCYDESQHSVAAHVHNDLHAADNVNKSLQATERRACEPVELVDADDLEPSVFTSVKITEVDLSSHDNECKRSTDTQMAVNQIEQLMSLEETDDFLNQMDLTEKESAFAGSQNLGIGGKQILMDELKNILKGNEDLVYGRTLEPLTASVGLYQSGMYDIDQLNNQAKHVDCQLNISNTFGSFLDAAVNAENSDPKPENEGRSILESPGLGTDPVTQQKEMEVENSVSATDAGNSKISGVLKVDDMVEKRGTSHIIDTPREEYAMVCKDMELKRLCQSCDVMDCANFINEDKDIEEGEISGDYRESDDSMDIMLQDAAVLKDKQASEACIEKKEFPYNKANEESLESDVLLLEINDSGKNGKRAKSCGSDRIMTSKAKTAVSGIIIKSNRADGCEIMIEAGKIEKKDSGVRASSLVLQGQALEEDATKDHQITPTVEDGKVRREKKRGPPSKERKAKKKQKERKKRAERNRQLGVKRLKLPPILKPKPVSHCRHYILGRCHEGDKCKFSHDTVPLTKSKPCCHFARHSCMKGDDCPFDHQLSRYPCSNFVSNGSCIRGDSCMFSHKMPPKEDVANASNAITPELKRVSMPDNSGSHKKLNRGGTTQQNLNALSYFTKIHNLTGSRQSVEVNDPKQFELTSKGTAGSSPMVDPTKNKLGLPAPSSIAVFTSRNSIDENASSSLQNSNEKFNRTSPVAVPKGINFLSFGKSPSDDYSTRKPASLPLGTESGANSLQSDNSDLCNQASSAPKSGVMLKGVQPEAAPKAINSLSFGKSAKNETVCKEKFSLPACGDNSNDGYVQQKRNVIDIPQTSSAISSTPMSSLVSSVPFSGHVASRVSKDTPHSAQKALLATLAFAAKYESGMKLNPSFVSPVSSRAFDKETRNIGNCGGLESDSEKAAKILDFLSSCSSSSKNKQ